MTYRGHRRNGGVSASSQSLMAGVFRYSSPLRGQYLDAREREKENPIINVLRAGNRAGIKRKSKITLPSTPFDYKGEA